MCIDVDEHHFDGSSFVYINDFCYYINCLYTHRYNFSSEKKKSQYMISHPKTSSDLPNRWDRESGCDNLSSTLSLLRHTLFVATLP